MASPVKNGILFTNCAALSASPADVQGASGAMPPAASLVTGPSGSEPKAVPSLRKRTFSASFSLPPDSPEKRKVPQDAFSTPPRVVVHRPVLNRLEDAQDAFSTPPRVVVHRPVLNRLQDARYALTDLFPGIVPLEKTSREQLPNAWIYEVRTHGCAFPVARQPSAFGCGPGCVLMATNPEVQKQLTEELWYTECSMATAADLKAKFAHYRIPATHLVFDRAIAKAEFQEEQVLVPAENGTAAVRAIRKILTHGSTLILGVTLPQIDGHWVTINRLGDDLFLLRDPYTGEAGAIDGAHLAPFILHDDVSQENAVLVQESPNQRSELTATMPSGFKV